MGNYLAYFYNNSTVYVKSVDFTRGKTEKMKFCTPLSIGDELWALIRMPHLYHKQVV